MNEYPNESQTARPSGPSRAASPTPSDEYYAHIAADGRRQTVGEHLRGTAERAGAALERVGLRETAYLAGLLHDMGKFKREFLEYLEKSNRNDKSAAPGSVIHTFAAVKYLLRKYHSEDASDTDKIYRNITCELISYAVGAHHGLFDCVDELHRSGFQHRLDANPAGDEEAMRIFETRFLAPEELENAFRRAQEEICCFMERSPVFIEVEDDKDFEEYAFFLGLLARLLASAVMEGDRHDTAEFMDRVVYPEPADQALWRDLLKRVEYKLSLLPADTQINRARREISDRCREAARKSEGVYRLNVPTGGGKTLSSLRYALAHAEHFKKKRIIFTSPLLSILDQNSRVIREYVGDDRLILEHHSNVVIEKDEEEKDPTELLIESWSPPIIVTTLVQLLNTMFSGKTSAVRRFQALTDSVIVIDEVQTVPIRMLTLFNLTVSFLAELCHTTVILCSATQPSQKELKHPMRVKVEDLIPADRELWSVFKRTDIRYAGTYALSELPYLAEHVLEQTDSLLIVCNKKAQSEELFSRLQKEGRRTFHLSAAMCKKHRTDELDLIYKSLEKRDGMKTVCVSTQVIEAGVDISFGAVIRLQAGLDSIVQAAGRCNRNRESEENGQVYIVRISDEDLSSLPEMKEQREGTGKLLDEFRGFPDRFLSDLSSEPSIEFYYDKLFSDSGFSAVYCDYALSKGLTLFSMLSQNEDWVSEENSRTSDALRQAFASAGKKFSVFDSDTVDVIVPYGEGKELILDLLSEKAARDVKYVGGLLQKAKPFTVSLYAYQRKKLEEMHALIPLAGGIALGLSEAYYHSRTGVNIDQKKEDDGLWNNEIL